MSGSSMKPITVRECLYDRTDFEEVIALDMQYINNWTIYEDIKIILKTVGLLFSGGGAK